MYTFSCPACHKEHSFTEPFMGPFQTRCFRCQNPIRVTQQNIREDPRSKKIPRPTPPTQASPKSNLSSQVSTRTGPLGRHKWLVSSLVTTMLVVLGLGGYVIFGGGVRPAEKKSPAAAPPKSKNVVASLPNRAAVKPAVNSKTNPAKETSPKVGQNPAKETAPKASQSNDNVTPAKNVSYRPRPLVPHEIVREAFEKRFGKRVIVTTVRLENGNLTLEGELLHWEDLRPAREVAVKALETAGFGPIRSWDNHLKKTKE